MMGLIILAVIAIYAFLASSIVRYVYTKTGNNKKRYLVIAIAILLPFWDMILHYPVYWILSSTVPEVERYKPYEKVEGFYEDYIPGGNVAYNMFLHKTFENKYSIYFEEDDKYNKKERRWDKKYYKAFWLNNSNSPTCFPLQPSTVEGKYIELINNNWCISVEEIDESQMTKYWELNTKEVFHLPIFYLNIYIVDFFVSDRHTGEPFLRYRDVFVDRSWLTAINFVSGRKSVKSGTKFTYGSSGGGFHFPDYNIIKILDSKELPNI
jgi:hypothetical protein